MGLVRKFFAGSNSSEGFYSLFNQIIGADAKRVYLLKGGPGTGKNHFMKNIERSLAQQGYDRELFFCSSDPDSLDAISFPELGIALIDATAPHAQEPKWPGCRDEIINLGSFWSAEGLMKNREEIIQDGLMKQRRFVSAFRYFNAARCLEENIAARNSKQARNNDLELKKVYNLICESRANISELGKIRRLFASALTPEGYVSHITDLVEEYTNIYILRGFPGTGKSEELKKIVDLTQIMGLDIEVFLYPLDPKKLLHVLIPKLHLAILTETTFESLEQLNAIRIQFGESDSQQELNSNDVFLFKELIDLGIDSLNEARLGHGKIEEIYGRQMDFEALESYGHAILAEINNYKNFS